MAYHLSRKRKKSIKLATTNDIALIVMVADQRGFFYDYNINIEFVRVPYARKGMELLIDGKVDISSLVETNFAYLGYLKPKNPIKCFVSVEKRSADNLLILGKNVTPENLYGKTVAFMPKTTSHSFLIQFLKKHKIPKQSIKLKTCTPQAMPNALIRGEFDAMSLWDPYCSNTILDMKELGLDYTHFENSGFYKSEVVLGASKTFLVKHKEEAKNILKALKEAEKFLKSDEETAFRILTQKMKILDINAKNVLRKFNPALSPIGPSYFENIETLSEWIKNSDTEFKDQAPSNYLDFIDNSLFLDIDKEI